MYIYETKDSKKIQDCVIAQIKNYRYKKRKDFYEIDINILKNIIRDSAELTQKYKKSLTKINKTNQEGGTIKYNLFLYIKY